MNSHNTINEAQLLHDFYRPQATSHKGENGRLLVIGGSQLFHASIFWSAEIASKIVDLVHFSSPSNENNELVRRKLKSGFWEGIVVDFAQIEFYITEDDCILIGPGMPRNDGLMPSEIPTGEIVNSLLTVYPHKKWVIDGGALQSVDPSLLNQSMIITPHHKEWAVLMQRQANEPLSLEEQIEEVKRFSIHHNHVTVLLKGKEDIVCQGDVAVVIPGGNPGMTKGGTGDVLAGLTAALYCKNSALVSAQVAALVMKKSAESLHEKVGIYFSAGDLLKQVPETLHRITT